MAAGPYIKAAATQLHSAANDLQSQIRAMQSDHDQNKRQTNAAITQMELQIKTQQATAQMVNDEQQKKAADLAAHQVQQQIDQQKQALQQQEQQVNQAIQAKTDFLHQLETIAKQLDVQAGSPAAA